MSVDFKTLFQDRGISFIENDKNFILNQCPVCSGVHKLHVDKKNGQWICFKCYDMEDKDANDGKGNTYSILRLIGLSHHEAREIMGGTFQGYTDDFVFEAMNSDQVDSEESEEAKEMMLPWYFRRLEGTEECFTENIEAYNYLLSRGVNNINIINMLNYHLYPRTG